MPTFIPARGRTLHLAGACVNRIGKRRHINAGDLVSVLLQLYNHHLHMIACCPSWDQNTRPQRGQ